MINLRLDGPGYQTQSAEEVCVLRRLEGGDPNLTNPHPKLTVTLTLNTDPDLDPDPKP